MKFIHNRLWLLPLGLGLIFIHSCIKEDIKEEYKLSETNSYNQNTNKTNDESFDNRLASVLKGGLERSNDRAAVELRANTAARILINGGILGHNKANYANAYVSNSNNLMADAETLLQRLDYSVSYVGNDLVAVRNAVNSYGATRIRMTKNSRTMNCKTPSGYGSRYLSFPEAVTVENGRFLVPARMLAVLGGVCLDHWDEDSKSLQVYYNEELDMGLYFYGKQNGVSSNDTVAGCQKYIEGEPNLFFDPNKPTFIYIHGWMPNLSKGMEGFILNFNENGQSTYQNIQNYWIDKGWNFAAYNWRQIADDDTNPQLNPLNTEKKIYDANVGMRWKKSDGSFSSRPTPNLAVRQLFSQEYKKLIQALAPNAEIRMLGASLGGNLVMAMLREIAIDNLKVPARITLGDPYWDPSLDHGADGISLPDGLTNTRAFGEDAALRLDSKGVAIEYVSNSAFNTLMANKGITNIATFIKFWPEYSGDLTLQHITPPFQYIWSMGLPNITNSHSPQISNANIRAEMNTQFHWEQIEGQATITPADDVFILKAGKP